MKGTNWYTHECIVSSNVSTWVYIPNNIVKDPKNSSLKLYKKTIPRVHGVSPTVRNHHKCTSKKGLG